MAGEYCGSVGYKRSAASSLHDLEGNNNIHHTKKLKIKILLRGFNKSICKHAKVLNEVCLHCNERMDAGYGVGFDYLEKGLRYSKAEVSRLKEIHSMNLFRKKKLQLVLDLDHTLLHSRDMGKLKSREKYLKNTQLSDGSLFRQENSDSLVKLRPYVGTFLKEASTMFEMYVCTMGSRGYANRVAKLLDPNGDYFGSRIVTFEDFNLQRQRKNLDLVLGQESGIVILDDTETVWSEHSHNLIVAEPYDYFRNKKRNGKCKSHAEKMTDESETNGLLVNVLNVLKRIHGLFFADQSSFGCRDVRGLMANIRSEVLKGCTIYIDDGMKDFPFIWSRAEEMGAECTTVLDSSVTHVVSIKRGTEECRWLEKENKFVVHPKWIDAAYHLWSRQPEHEYLP